MFADFRWWEQEVQLSDDHTQKSLMILNLLGLSVPA